MIAEEIVAKNVLFINVQLRLDIDFNNKLNTKKGDLIPRSLGIYQVFRHILGARNASYSANRYALSCTSTALRWGASFTLQAKSTEKRKRKQRPSQWHRST